MEHLHDPTDGGWVEHALPDWSPPGPGRRVPIRHAGLKGANAHLHWMEALLELGAETGDPAVMRSLGEVVDLVSRHFHPPDPRAARSFVTRDWQPVPGLDDAISLGHNV